MQEQALNVIRNLAENEDGIDLVFSEVGPRVLLDHLVAALGSTNEDVVLQVRLPPPPSLLIIHLSDIPPPLPNPRTHNRQPTCSPTSQMGATYTNRTFSHTHMPLTPSTRVSHGACHQSRPRLPTQRPPVADRTSAGQLLVVLHSSRRGVCPLRVRRSVVRALRLH